MVRLLAVLAVLVSGTVFGQTNNFRHSVSLAWDPSPGSDIAGYSIYMGGSHLIFTNRTFFGNVTNCTIGGLNPRGVYYFVATATDTSGLESDFSNEVSYTVPANPPVVPPNLRVVAAAIEESTNMVVWTSTTNLTIVVGGTTNGVKFYRAVVSIH